MTFEGFSYRHEWEFNVCFILPEMLIELTPYTLCAECNLQLEALRALQQISACSNNTLEEQEEFVFSTTFDFREYSQLRANI